MANKSSLYLKVLAQPRFLEAISFPLVLSLPDDHSNALLPR
jgi:hypothetical protein